MTAGPALIGVCRSGPRGATVARVLPNQEGLPRRRRARILLECSLCLRAANLQTTNKTPTTSTTASRSAMGPPTPRPRSSAHTATSPWRLHLIPAAVPRRSMWKTVRSAASRGALKSPMTPTASPRWSSARWTSEPVQWYQKRVPQQPRLSCGARAAHLRALTAARRIEIMEMRLENADCA